MIKQVKHIEQYQHIVAQEIETFINSLPLQPEGLYEPVRYLLASEGKRIRPTLVLMACNMFSGSCQAARKPAIAFEVFHNFTLAHDDLMDQSPLRRGRATVHIHWNPNTAILSGDAMNILTYSLFEDLPAETLKKILPLFNRTALEICEGQQLDMEYESRNNVTAEEYLNMIRLKTSVLLAASLKTGAIIGGAPEALTEQLYDFGIAMGLAFQLQDDYLDAFGGNETFGKRIGGDIISNKKTMLLIQALNSPNPAIAQAVNALISNEAPDPQKKVEQMLNLYQEAGVKDTTRELISAHYNQALHILESLDTDTQKKQGLYELADMLRERKK